MVLLKCVECAECSFQFRIVKSAETKEKRFLFVGWCFGAASRK
jgi:hypothetical protein